MRDRAETIGKSLRWVGLTAAAVRRRDADLHLPPSLAYHRSIAMMIKATQGAMTLPIRFTFGTAPRTRRG
jgi:hypothetical protein